MLALDQTSNSLSKGLLGFVWPPVSVKGAPIAKFRFSTFEFGVETITIGFVILQNPGSGGRNFRIDPYVEVTAKLIFWHGAF